ncbi:MAG TPA: hypothetical protein VM597_40820 [Gemmataceae bacterium]|nr:hypothetical protein [Gemmataceae bacterium]
MAVRTLYLSGVGLAACLVLCGNGYPQQPPPAPTSPSLPAPVAAPDLAPSVFTPVVPAPTPGTTVDQLLDRLTELRRQKAELEKQEQLVVKQLRDRLKAQTERLEKLGIAPEPKATPPVKDEAKAEALRLPEIPRPASTR